MAGSSAVSTKMIAALAAGVGVAVVGGGYLLKDDVGQPIILSLLSPSVPEKKNDEVAALPDSEAGDAEAETPVPSEIVPLAEKSILPTFDLLRVERDGSVVIAGNAPADHKIEILENGEVLGSGRSASGGDFAIVFDKPLAPGPHELTIKATPGEEAAPGTPVLHSAETGIVTIPQKDAQDSEVLAMVQREGVPSRVLQQPQSVEETEPPLDAPEGEEADVSVEEAEQKQAETAQKQAAKVDVETEDPQPAKPAAPLQVKAIDVESDRMFIAGSGKPGSRVRVYIDNVFKGGASVGAHGGFLVELSEGLEPGKHDFRVDQLAGNAPNVTGRVAVVVEHEVDAPAEAETQTAEAAPEPKEQPVQTEPSGESVKPEGEAVARVTDPESAGETEGQEVQAQASESTDLKAVDAGEPEAVGQQEAATSDAETGEAPVIKTGRSVIIRKGDNLWRVSRRMLGQGRKYTIIFQSNANQIKDPNLIFPGQVFEVPDEANGSGAETNKGENQR